MANTLPNYSTCRLVTYCKYLWTVYWRKLRDRIGSKSSISHSEDEWFDEEAIGVATIFSWYFHLKRWYFHIFLLFRWWHGHLPTQENMRPMSSRVAGLGEIGLWALDTLRNPWEKSRISGACCLCKRVLSSNPVCFFKIEGHQKLVSNIWFAYIDVSCVCRLWMLNNCPNMFQKKLVLSELFRAPRSPMLFDFHHCQNQNRQLTLFC